MKDNPAFAVKIVLMPQQVNEANAEDLAIRLLKEQGYTVLKSSRYRHLFGGDKDIKMLRKCIEEHEKYIKQYEKEMKERDKILAKARPKKREVKDLTKAQKDKILSDQAKWSKKIGLPPYSLREALEEEYQMEEDEYGYYEKCVPDLYQHGQEGREGCKNTIKEIVEIRDAFINCGQNISKVEKFMEGKGLPDLLAYNKKEAFFVEVKCGNDGIRRDQLAWLQSGLPCVFWFFKERLQQKRMPDALAQEKIEKAKLLRKQGVGLQKIADQLGVSVSWVYDKTK